MRRSRRCPPPARATVPASDAAQRHGGMPGERDAFTPTPTTTSRVSAHFTLPRLLESGQAVEIIPGVLYFASIAERPPPVSDFTASCDSRRGSLDSGAAATLLTPELRPAGAAQAGLSSAGIDHVAAMSASSLTVPPQPVSLPHVLRPLQMPGPQSSTGAEVSATFSVSNAAGSVSAGPPLRPGRAGPTTTTTTTTTAATEPAHKSPTSRRESLLSLIDLPLSSTSLPIGMAGKSATTQPPSATTGHPPAHRPTGTAAAASTLFSLKDYLKGHYPNVSYPARATSADPRHAELPVAAAGVLGGGSGGAGASGGLLKTAITRPPARAASAGTYHGLSSASSAPGGARRRADRSVSISVVPLETTVAPTESPSHPLANTSMGSNAAAVTSAIVGGGSASGGGVGVMNREVDAADLDSHDGSCSPHEESHSAVHFPPVAAHLPEALLQPGDGGNGGACLLSPHDGAFYVSIFGDPAFEYRSFFADFGPLDLGCVVRFSRRLAKLLEMSAGFEWHDTDKIVSEMTMGSAAAAAAAAVRKKRALSVLEAPSDLSARLADVVPIVVCTGLETHERANVACLLGCFCVGALRWSASAVQQRLQQQVYPPLLAFRDASSGASSYPLTVTDVVRGMRKAAQLGWVDMRTFDVEAYDRAKVHDYNWIVPHKILAMSSPEDDKPTRCAGVYARLLGSLGVTMVVRLNDALYDARTFWQSGIHHVELEFPDGTAPNDADLKHFLSAVEEEFGECVGTSTSTTSTTATMDTARGGGGAGGGGTVEVGGTYRGLPPAKTHVPTPPSRRRTAPAKASASSSSSKAASSSTTCTPTAHHGVVAVHCRAGLGRTGTVIAVYMMRHYGFTARESISWIRLCRPGSITGIQQQYLETIERRLTPPARVWTDLQWAASAAGSVGYGGGGRMDASQPAYQLHGAVAMDASRAGGAAMATPGSGGGPRADLLGTSMTSEALPSFPLAASSPRRSTLTIFHSGVSRTLAPSGVDTATAPTPMGGAATGASEGKEASLSGLFLRRPTPPNYAADSFAPVSVAMLGGGGGSRPGTGMSVGGNNNNNNNSAAVADAVAAEQRYELAEVEALLCDPTFVPHRSILEHLKYPSSYFLALEQANPFGTAVALQREFAARRRRQQPVGTQAAVEKVSYTPSKGSRAPLSPSATASNSNNNNNAAASGSAVQAAASVTGAAAPAAGSAAAARRPLSGGASLPSSLTKAGDHTGPHTRLGSGGGHGGEAGAVSPTDRPSLRLDTSLMQAAVARSNAALTSRGGIASRYQAIRTRESHAMQDVAPITVPSRLRLNSVQLDSDGAAAPTISSGGGGVSSSNPPVPGGASGLSYREGVYGTRRVSVSVGDTSFPLPTPSTSSGGAGLSEGLLESSLLLHGNAPLQAVNSSARSLHTAPVTLANSAGNLVATASLGTAVSRQSSMPTTSRTMPASAGGGASGLYTLDVAASGLVGGSGGAGTGGGSGGGVAQAGASAVYGPGSRGASVAALQPLLIAASGGNAVSASNSALFLPTVGPSSAGPAHRKAARLGWGAREVRVAR